MYDIVHIPLRSKAPSYNIICSCHKTTFYHLRYKPRQGSGYAVTRSESQNAPERFLPPLLVTFSILDGRLQHLTGYATRCLQGSHKCLISLDYLYDEKHPQINKLVPAIKPRSTIFVIRPVVVRSEHSILDRPESSRTLPTPLAGHVRRPLTGLLDSMKLSATSRFSLVQSP